MLTLENDDSKVCEVPAEHQNQVEVERVPSHVAIKLDSVLFCQSYECSQTSIQHKEQNNVDEHD